MEPLRYYMHDGSDAFRFELAGSLSSASAMELERAWRTASSTIDGRDLIVDLSYVTSIDEAGHELLGKWHAHGARFVVISTDASARIQSMTDYPVTLIRTSRAASTWLPFRAAALWLAAFYLLLCPASGIAARFF